MNRFGIDRSTTLLVVDDEPEIRALLTDLLVDTGHKVYSVPDGAEALETLRSAPPPCAIILDLMLPRVNGWQVLRTLRADHDLADIPVIVLSAHSDAVSVAREYDVDVALSKPFDPSELLTVVQERCPGHARSSTRPGA
ncbi:MAG TPA: response regulator [Candidatus Limnocylindria bacterium]|nr:response regulator [Candidatus Limnocylindria bacterium]